jgi:hypothetical protein
VGIQKSSPPRQTLCPQSRAILHDLLEWWR